MNNLFAHINYIIWSSSFHQTAQKLHEVKH